jgi:hypothetical protein
MTRLGLAVLAVLAALSTRALAEPAPTTGTAAAATAPTTAAPPAPNTTEPAAPSAGTPEAKDRAPEMPQGHPPVSPHGAVGASPQPERTPNSEEPAGDLAPGTVEVTLLDASDEPLAGMEVRLGILFQKIAEGESRSSKLAKTGPDGRARFE